MNLGDFTRAGLIVPRLQGEDAASVIKELSEALQAAGCVTDLLPFYQAALHREFLGGTEVGGGMAFPHARVSEVARVTFALGRGRGPLRWGSGGGTEVRLVFLIAVPTTDATEYLQLISGLARLSKDPSQLAALVAAPDGAGMLEVLRRVETRPSSWPAGAAGLGGRGPEERGRGAA